MAVMRRRTYKRKGATKYRRSTKRKSYRGKTRNARVTAQRDSAVTYIKARLPKRLWKAKNAFNNRVQRANDRNLGTISVVFNKVLSISPFLETQSLAVVQLLGLRGTNTSSEIGMGDVFDLVAGDVGQDSPDTRFHIKSAVLDLTCTCEGASNESMEVDIYEYYIPRDTQHTSVLSCLQDAEGDTNVIPGGIYTDLIYTQRGCTPFQFPGFLRSVTIKSKTKHFVLPGQSFTHQIRDTRIHHVSSKYVLDAGTRFGNSRVGTKGFIIVAKAFPTSAIESTTLSVGCVRTYNYSRENNVEDLNGYRNI